MLCPSRYAAMENSIGIVGIDVGDAPTSKTFRPFLKTSLTTALSRCGAGSRADHPLVVLGHLARARLNFCCGGATGRVAHDAVVEADERQVRLGDHQVLVVARLRDQRRALRAAALPLPTRGRSKFGIAGSPLASVPPVFRRRPSL